MYDSENDDSVKPKLRPRSTTPSCAAVELVRPQGLDPAQDRCFQRSAPPLATQTCDLQVISKPVYERYCAAETDHTPSPATFQYHHGGQWRSHSRRITSLRFLFPMTDRTPEASGFLLLHDVLAVERVLAMRWSVHLRPSCHMTVPVPVLVLSASQAHPTPESLVETDLARRSPGHVFPISRIRGVILGLTRQVEYLALLALAVFGLADELLRSEPLRRGLLTIPLFTLLHPITHVLQLLTIFTTGCIWSDSGASRVLFNLHQDPVSDVAPRAQHYSSRIHLLTLTLFSYRHLPKARYLFVSSNTALRGLSFTASRRQSQKLFFGSWIPSSTWFNFITAL
jgi:hypothetical protein